ncbi:MAG: hypothetical protein JSU08_15855 [Acidobacteria bacterium]|nr:hypothetical protein [Acidobacteriota bacterium]
MANPETSLAVVTRALGLAVFVRQPDGGFEPVGPAPEWFVRVTSDDTFPFLGHILEEATAFWQRRQSGRADWGPVAEVDDQGREYHYLVSALLVDGAEYLVFQLDAGAERMREVLQKVRSEALSAEQDHASHRAVAADLQRTVSQLQETITRLVQTSPTPLQAELMRALGDQTVALKGGIGRLVQSTSLRRA